LLRANAINTTSLTQRYLFSPMLSAAAAAAAGGGHVAALRLKLEKLTALAASRRTLATAFWSQK
jgi:hypothetical protein